MKKTYLSINAHGLYTTHNIPSILGYPDAQVIALCNAQHGRNAALGHENYAETWTFNHFDTNPYVEFMARQLCQKKLLAVLLQATKRICCLLQDYARSSI